MYVYVNRSFTATSIDKRYYYDCDCHRGSAAVFDFGVVGVASEVWRNVDVIIP
jgi:hypothetical protein